MSNLMVTNINNIPAVPFASQLAHFRYEEVDDVVGTSLSAGWNIVPLNTEKTNLVESLVFDDVNHQLSLPVGTYFIMSFVPAHLSDQSRVGIYDVTNSQYLDAGSTLQSWDQPASSVLCPLITTLTFSVATVIELRMSCSNSGTYGNYNNHGDGLKEVFGDLMMWKVA
ncbi:MAG: hypothetical protein HWE30_11615 [Methylocystaceae bacterium]|nr:hypothetical protein [Methylocystaceae bacterium]